MNNQVISPTSYFYDAAGRTTSVKDVNGRDTSYQYDRVELRSKMTLPKEISNIFNGSFKNAEKGLNF